MTDIHCLLRQQPISCGQTPPHPFQQNLVSVWVQASSSVSRYTQYFNPRLLRLFYRNACNPGQPSRKTSEMMYGAALGERQSGERELGRTVKPDLATFLEPLDYAHTWLHTFHLCGSTDFPFCEGRPSPVFCYLQLKPLKLMQTQCSQSPIFAPTTLLWALFQLPLLAGRLFLYFLKF